MPNVDKLVKAQAIAVLLDVSIKTVYRWAAEDFIPCYPIAPGVRRFSVPEVIAWVATRKVKGRTTRLNAVY